MIYLDNSATTKMSEAALDAYVKTATEVFGNPSSRHAVGQAAHKALEAARKTVLSSFDGDGTVVFCASGTEADNLAILGRATAKERFKRGKIVAATGEHSAVREALSRLERDGFRVAYIPTVGGRLDTEALKSELTPDVFLVTSMTVNNETGAVYDIPALSRMMRVGSPDAILHIDATQSYLKLPLSVKATGASLVTVSAHKVEGPKGVSALYVSHELLRKQGLSPTVFGGGQEGGLRSGTENLPGIAAFAAAVTEGMKNRAAFYRHTDSLRARILDALQNDPVLSEVRPVLPESAAPHILSLTLPSIKSEVMLNFLSARDIMVSSGSACSSHAQNLSNALLSFGLSPHDADCTVRVSLGRENTVEEIDAFLSALRVGISSLARIKK